VIFATARCGEKKIIFRLGCRKNAASPVLETKKQAREGGANLNRGGVAVKDAGRLIHLAVMPTVPGVPNETIGKEDGCT
jgi:hypothetical protein